MLKELKFVQGSVAKKDFVPELTHFVISEGKVRGFNGVMALCSPIPFNIECKPKAAALVKAIANCGETINLAMTPAGRLSVKSAGFKAFVDCLPSDETLHAMPEGEHVVIDGEALLAAVKAVAPFMSDDASRPWSNGILFRGQSAYATNNIVLVEYWTGVQVEHAINLPRAAVKEMLRINEAPVAIQATQNSITFHYAGERWLRTQLLATDWPDLAAVLDRPSAPQPIHAELFQALTALKPFTDKMGRVLFSKDRVHTHEAEGEGASFDIAGFDHTGAYPIEMLALLEGTAQTVDWSTYPSPCMFFGDRLRGAIIGMKL